MALARTLAVALTGLDGELIEVECDISAGLPGISFTGLPDASVVESRDRLRSALLNSEVDWPDRRVTVALLPADVRKVGSRFDLAVGVAILAASGQVPLEAVSGAVWIAELGLDGRLRPVRGVLPAVLAARRAGVRRVVVAEANAAEAALVGDMDVRSASSLTDVVGWLTGAGPVLPAAAGGALSTAPDPTGTDLADVAGQPVARRALEIAAAGGHHLYLVGTPGAGKTMLAERLPGILPPLDDPAAIEVTAVHSIAGLLGSRAELIRRPPFQAPHHSASTAALVGGGPNLARPGAISLAHHGVLFLDEAAELAPRALDALRQPLESGQVVLHRRSGSVRYPARFQLVLAANPCPCGLPALSCTCSAAARRRHAQRLSGPLMDRVDLRVQVDPVPHAELFDPEIRETSAQVGARVAAARAAAAERWRGAGWAINSAAPGARLRQAPWSLPPGPLRPLQSFLEHGALTARGFDRVLRIAWTLADLAGRAVPGADDVSEALYYRTGQVGTWAA